MERSTARINVSNVEEGSPSIECLTFGDGQSRAPLVPQDVQTDTAVAVDVGVVDAGGEVDFWRLEGVVCGEVDCEEEDAARVR